MRQWLAKLGWKLQRFMQGRNGQDSLGNATLILAVALALLGSLFSASWLSIPAMLLLIVNIFRIYSKNLEKRRRENAAYLKLVQPVRQWWQISKKKWTDRKTHRYFKCPKCGKYLRVPKGKGHIKITCKECGERFEKVS